MNKLLCSVLLLAVTSSLVDADCPTNPIVPNASLDKDNSCGDLIMKCNSGYTMKQVVQCVNEEWKFQEPVCEPSGEVNPCLNNGILQSDGKCQCANGFTGDKCESEVNPCLNNGILQSDGKCQCANGFIGDKCENELSTCPVDDAIKCVGLNECPQFQIDSDYVCEAGLVCCDPDNKK